MTALQYKMQQHHNQLQILNHTRPSVLLRNSNPPASQPAAAVSTESWTTALLLSHSKQSVVAAWQQDIRFPRMDIHLSIFDSVLSVKAQRTPPPLTATPIIWVWYITHVIIFVRAQQHSCHRKYHHSATSQSVRVSSVLSLHHRILSESWPRWPKRAWIYYINSRTKSAITTWGELYQKSHSPLLLLLKLLLLRAITIIKTLFLVLFFHCPPLILFHFNGVLMESLYTLDSLCRNSADGERTKRPPISISL